MEKAHSATFAARGGIRSSTASGGSPLRRTFSTVRREWYGRI